MSDRFESGAEEQVDRPKRNNKGVSLDQIVASLKDMQRSNLTKETEWLYEKSQMTQRVNQLEGMLKAQESINEDLIKRIKMLEYCLREERIKYARVLHQNGGALGENGQVDIIGSVLQKANLNATLYERVAKRRAKAQRPLLLKFLQEVGYEDIFNTDEINEIKDLYDKAQSELQEQIAEASNIHKQQLEEKVLDVEHIRQSERQEVDSKEEIQKQSEAQPEQNSHSQPEEPSKDNIKFELDYKYTLRSHLDIVRGVHFLNSIDSMVSISEDCMVKLWSMRDLEQKYESTNGNVEPYLTLRGHTGPLLSITGSTQDHLGSQNLIFTAGIEGSIRLWNVPAISDVNQYGDTFDGRNYCIGVWSDSEQDAFWDIKYHPFQNLLLSVGAGGSILVWNCAEIDGQQEDNPAKIVSRFAYSEPGSPSDFTPTACSWLPTQQNEFVAGFIDSHLVFFDDNQGSISNAFNMYKERINKIVAHPSTNLVATAHEDGTVAQYDFGANVITSTFKAHNDSVSALSYSPSGFELVTGSHDGSVKVWDLRNSSRVLFEIESAHQKKYDEGVQCLQIHPTMPFLVSGGSDSLIKVFEMQQ